ncbi:MAG TPA: SMI1/KNR4 family protein [Chloroflexia bacterium]|nr:SMI1/KNR4 family protein [Chloroflexia bacterium]
MNDLIQRLNTWLQKNRPTYYEQLLPGATDEDILLLEHILAIELPQDFKMLLQWKNGQSYKAQSFWDGYKLIPSNSIIAAYQMLENDWRVKTPEFIQNNWWNPKWMPFLYDGSGNYYCLDMMGVFGGKPGQIIIYWHDETQREIAHESFYKWLETVVRAWELELEEEDPFYGEYGALFQEINPGYPVIKELQWPHDWPNHARF